MTQNKVSDCHGAEMIWRYSTLSHPAVQKSPLGSGYFSCKKCHRPCTPVKAKDDKPPEDREFVVEDEKIAKCTLCGEPMPPGEEMFYYHGYSGACPKPPLKESPAPRPTEGWEERFDKKFEDVIVSTSRNDPDVYMDEWKEVGNIKSFIAAELAKAREEGYDKGADEWAENLKIAVEKEKKIALASYRAELENLWTIVRPFVVGYAAEHNVGNNRKMAIEAEEIVSRLLAEPHQEEK